MPTLAPSPRHPPFEVRRRLAELRADDLGFEAAWAEAMRLLRRWPHDTEQRRAWRAALEETREEWRAAYERHPTEASADVIALEAALDERTPHLTGEMTVSLA